MRKLLLLGLLLVSGTAAAVNCDLAYTRYERTVCGSEELLELSQEFELLAGDALLRQLRSAGQINGLRNRIASRCRHSSRMAECLVRQQMAGIVDLTVLLGTIVEVPAKFRGVQQGQLKQRNSRVIPEHFELRREEHGEIALLELYRARLRQGSPEPEVTDQIVRLQALLRAGCASAQHQQWHSRLTWYGLSCKAR